ncbi:hypothetical protein [uncultured Tenacibaculum sp.]|uniref:hypothetical protein n=1 Tax=uncultured Tenacibaculum sp. TaxID=174713 RepID=UPI00262D8004|nr:hypothetical protein [uncultured Tenacibaculum sp.]
MEYLEVDYNNILNSLHKLISLTTSEITINSILIVGSNYDIASKKKIRKGSDIDFVILNSSKTFAVKEKFQDITYDIAFINHTDMGAVVLGALSGSPFFGKFFSSINKHSIIKDTDRLGSKFVSIIKYLYSCFTASFIPNYEISTISLDSIAANKDDIEKNSVEEMNFASIRLSEHTFNYLSYLSYPIHTSGSYRGKVIEKHFQYTENRKNQNCILDKNDLVNIADYIAPVAEYRFFGFDYDESIQEAISQNKIENYYYGFDNLISERNIVFLSEKDVMKNNFQLLYIKNIIPFLKENQLNVCTDFFISLSNKHEQNTLENRVQFLLSVFNYFKKEEKHQIILHTLKSLFIIKSIHLLEENEHKMSIEVFDEWLLQTKDDFYFPEDAKMEVDLNEILAIISQSKLQREMEVKTCYLFFGIMKALRVNIEDFHFEESLVE